jgi:hypothetical protein
MRVLNARQRKGRIKTQEKKTRDESRVDQEFAIQYGGPSDGHEQRSGKRERGGDCSRHTEALDPQFAEPAHVHPPCPIVRPFTIRVHA